MNIVLLAIISRSPFIHGNIQGPGNWLKRKSWKTWKGENNEEFKTNLLLFFNSIVSNEVKFGKFRGLLTQTKNLSCAHFACVCELFIIFYNENREYVIERDTEFKTPLLCEMVEQLFSSDVSIKNFLHFTKLLDVIDMESGISKNKDESNDTALARIKRRAPKDIKKKLTELSIV